MEHIVNFSAGKESTAMLIRMLELDMPVDKIMFGDNGLEYPEVYEYIKVVEAYINRKVIVIKPKRTWDELFYTKVIKGKREGAIRGFPFCCVPGCWASRDLKIRPMEHARPKDALIYLGINCNEKYRVQHEKGHSENLRYPLIDWGWDEQKCLDYLEDKGLFPPLYKKFERTGCWLCPKQRMSSLKVLFFDYPELWAKLKQYEADCPHGFKPNLKLIDLEEKWGSQRKLDDF